ncbi:hypothetical protein DVA67_031910 [Solirubrobacter sp. CPCC 204708]|uniref:Uncharacterized protein n=1 Tax=Solirubrobacter deserti TaxID=2282478 RepID=A0ABT4RQ10_9ACTN|nr:hypothetical protein [Solirubrobacter deserti]MBE2320609.1 hypothetical protein [Solirubrobacter deserti]MDA0140664.1 hypothetical protein [Solirubrobacter deserti]
MNEPHTPIERYEGTCIAVSIELYRNESEKRDRLEFSVAPDVRMPQDIEELLFRAYTLSRQVHLTFTSGRDRSLCLQMVYGVISGIFRELDREAAMRKAGHDNVKCSQMKYLETACKRAEAYFARASQRRAQLRYLGGLGVGLLLTSAAGTGMTLGLEAVPETGDSPWMLFAMLLAGGLGAVLSVLFGMTSGNLKLHTLFAHAESGIGPLVAAGALRPLVGALSGLLAYVLLQSGIVPLEVAEGAQGTHFFIALAIVAGFSERWTRGLLAGTEERLQAAPAAKAG